MLIISKVFELEPWNLKRAILKALSRSMQKIELLTDLGKFSSLSLQSLLSYWQNYLLRSINKMNYIVLCSIFVFFFITWPSRPIGAPCGLSNFCMSDRQTCLLLRWPILQITWQIIILWVERSRLSVRWLIVKLKSLSKAVMTGHVLLSILYCGFRVVRGLFRGCNKFVTPSFRTSVACLGFVTRG